MTGRPILVVDDEADLRFVVRLMLETAGYPVAEADSGEAALGLLETGTYSLVLLDIRLPGIDGFEVLRRIRRADDLASTAVVIMSAHTSPDTLARARDEGSSGYLVKPFREEELFRVVADFCG